LVSAASAEECFVGEPVELPDTALGFSAKRDSGGIGRDVRERHFVRRQIDLGGWPPRARSSLPITERNGGGNFFREEEHPTLNVQ
jgi:hypothetical protein